MLLPVSVSESAEAVRGVIQLCVCVCVCVGWVGHGEVEFHQQKTFTQSAEREMTGLLYVMF